MCLLERCMVRHTKRQVLGGQQVLQLPPKVEEDVPGETACLPACMHATRLRLRTPAPSSQQPTPSARAPLPSPTREQWC